MAGGFLAFFIPTKPGPMPHSGGLLGTVIRFEIDYTNLLMTIGLFWLLYWLLWRKIRGREAILMCGALAFVFVRLAISLAASLRN
jgi:hypothetical protein